MPGGFEHQLLFNLGVVGRVSGLLADRVAQRLDHEGQVVLLAFQPGHLDHVHQLVSQLYHLGAVVDQQLGRRSAHALDLGHVPVLQQQGQALLAGSPVARGFDADHKPGAFGQGTAGDARGDAEDRVEQDGAGVGG